MKTPQSFSRAKVLLTLLTTFILCNPCSSAILNGISKSMVSPDWLTQIMAARCGFLKVKSYNVISEAFNQNKTFIQVSDCQIWDLKIDFCIRWTGSISALSWVFPHTWLRSEMCHTRQGWRSPRLPTCYHTFQGLQDEPWPCLPSAVRHSLVLSGHNLAHQAFP